MSVKFPWRSILRPLLVFLFVMSCYQALVSGRVLPAADGASLNQTNIVKAQRYVYQNNSDLKMVMVGSSLAANINAKDIGEGVQSIALAGGATQTGLEIIKRSPVQPPIILAEINYTISRKLDSELLDSLYHPVFYWVRRYLPIMREEYRPVSVFIYYLKNPGKQDKNISKEELDKREARFLTPELSKRGIQMAFDAESQPLSEKETETIKKEAALIKSQIAEIKKNSKVRLVLFDIPMESRVDDTLRRKQIRALSKQLFPPESFEWLPPPPPREWRTNDGIHLIRSDSIDFAKFLGGKLLGK